ncbi:uncharacterized protein PAF06_004816 [Gastrophryne carolinensis]
MPHCVGLLCCVHRLWLRPRPPCSQAPVPSHSDRDQSRFSMLMRENVPLEQGKGIKMAPGNKSKKFTSSSVSSQRASSGTKKKKKRIQKRAKLPAPEAVRCYSPLVYDPEECLNELMQKYAKQPEASEISNLHHYEVKSLTGQEPAARMGISQDISRFEIPMDIKLLEKMPVHEYLKNYCRVCRRRQVFYKKLFDKFDRDKDGFLSITETERALSDVYQGQLHLGQVKELLVLATEELEALDAKLFFVLCAVSERLFYSTFVTEDSSGTYAERQWVETADFSAIRWKLEGCNISASLKRLISLLVERLGNEDA